MLYGVYGQCTNQNQHDHRKPQGRLANESADYAIPIAVKVEVTAVPPVGVYVRVHVAVAPAAIAAEPEMA